MRSLRTRMAVWFGGGFLLLAIISAIMSYKLFDLELRRKNWRQDYPSHPDWRLHGSYSESEVRDLTGELLGTTMATALPLIGLSVIVGYLLARKSLRPIASVNQQLRQKTAATLGEPITLEEMDVEFHDLLQQLNALLSRLHASFAEMNDYAAKVSHELRTPLSILRLKLEQHGEQIGPEFAEELQNELQRLTHVVDQSLLIARADQGRVLTRLSVFDLAEVAADLVADFQILAADGSRWLRFHNVGSCSVRADEAHVRQIVHNLLTNALKHGDGDIHVRVKRRRSAIVLLAVNQVMRAAVPSEATLGIGLRVVSALLRLDPTIRFQRRRGARHYAVRLIFDEVPTPAKSGSELQPSDELNLNQNKDFFI